MLDWVQINFPHIFPLIKITTGPRSLFAYEGNTRG
jgi:hypothetical protein